MNRQTIINLGIGVLVGLILAWLLGLFDPHSLPAPAASSAQAAAPGVPKPAFTTATATKASVAMPAVASVPAHGPDPAPAKASASATTTLSDPDNFDRVRQQSRLKAATNNLRILAASAQQYMEDKDVSSASYYDLVGTGTDNYVRSVSPVSGEDYTDFIIFKDQTQVSVSAASFGTVTFNL